MEFDKEIKLKDDEKNEDIPTGGMMDESFISANLM